MTDRPALAPKGVIAIVTAPDGDVIATVADFARDGIGGCKLYEAQWLRAKRAVKWQVVRAYCSDAIVNALDEYLTERIADALVSKGGHKIVCRAVGWPEDVAREIE